MYSVVENSAMSDDKLIYRSESYLIRGACFEVYKDKGCGFLEAVYQECLEIEFEKAGVAFAAQPKLELEYKGQKLKTHYFPDFVCFGRIVVELKAVSELTDEHRAQLHNYLKATGMRLGFLVNFGKADGVQIERIAK